MTKELYLTIYIQVYRFMTKKHVLIVDDAKDILFLLTHSVRRMSPDYEVSTATDGPTAIAQIQKRTFDLIITDYMMPGMTGLQLVQEVRQISPQTQVVLMTAYDSAALRTQVEDMQLGGFVGKPFTVPQVVKMVERIITQTNQPVETEPDTSPAMSQTVYEQLKTLHGKTGAHNVLLLNSAGYPLRVVGHADQSKISRLASFVSANFLAVTELASLLGDNSSTFKSSYYEGSNYNIYAYDINGEYLLAVIFGTAGKPGTVWFYTKQVATDLASLLGPAQSLPTVDDEPTDTTVAAEFDNLMSNGTHSKD